MKIYCGIYIEIFVLNTIFSFVSFVLLMFLIITQFCLRKKKGISYEFLLCIIISESVQCISKLLQIFRFSGFSFSLKTKNIVAQVQLVLSLYSDFSTLIASLFISLKIYDSMKKLSNNFRKKHVRIISRICYLLVPIILALLVYYVDKKGIFFGDKERDDYDEDSSECHNWIWVKERYLSLSIYIFYWIIIIINVVVSCEAIHYLHSQQKKLVAPPTVEEEQASISFNSYNMIEKDAKEVEGRPSTKGFENRLFRMIRKLYVYPVVSSCIWGLISVHRVIQIFVERDWNEMKNNTWFFNSLALIHAVVSSLRGLVYSFSYISTQVKGNLCKCSKEKKESVVSLQNLSVSLEREQIH